MKRFIKEYANYQLEQITSNELMKSKIKEEKINRIIKILTYAEQSYLSINELILELNKVY
mgnify:FL=1